MNLDLPFGMRKKMIYINTKFKFHFVQTARHFMPRKPQSRRIKHSSSMDFMGKKATTTTTIKGLKDWSLIKI